MLTLIGEFLSFSTFSSVWYWIFLAIAWSSRTHWTIGVPFDSIVRADKLGGTWESDLDAIAHAMSARFALLAGQGGPWIIGIAAFFLTGLITASVLTENEMVRGLTALALPMAIVEFGDVRLALRIHRTGLLGHDLRRAIVWRRFLNQVTGLFSLTLAAALAALTILQVEGVFLW